MSKSKYMGKHHEVEMVLTPAERSQELRRQLHKIGWGTEIYGPEDASYISIFSRESEPIGVMKDLPSSMTSWVKTKHFRAALAGLDPNEVHIHRAEKIGLLPWVEAHTQTAFEAVASRLAEVAIVPPGRHSSDIMGA